MQNKRTWLYLILMLILFTLIWLNQHITPPLPAETADGAVIVERNINK